MDHSLRSPLFNLGNLPQATSEPLKRGSAGNFQTINMMKKVAHQRKGHPLVRKLAENIINLYKTGSQDFYDEAYAIGDWVKQVVPYAKDPKGVEMLQDPITMIDKLKRNELFGDCDDMSLLIATLLLSLGHQPYFCIVRYPQFRSGFQHIYICVYEANNRDKKKRLVLDAIVKDRHTGYEVSYAEKKEIKA